MQIHIPTVAVVLILGYAMLALQISVMRQSHESAPLRMWNWGNWAMLGGFVFLVARLRVPLAVSAIGGNILFLVGMALYSQAIYRFLHGAAPRALWVLLGASILAVIGLYPLSFAYRISLYALLDMLVLLPGIWHILRHGWRQERALRTVAATLTLSCVGMVFRAMDAWSQPLEFGAVLQPGTGPTITFLVAFITMLGAGFGFILATLERSARHMEELATHDGLTHCLNRSAAIALLGNALQRGQRTGEATSLVMLDLDHFKDVNDHHGHRAGDEVLRQFAHTARARLRASDVLARMGGEEFAVILPGTDTVGAVHVAEAVRAAVEALVVSDMKGGSISITVSAGVACALGGSTPTTPDQLYHRADTALYAAKEAGRNRIELAPDL
ncbi:MAG: GGDEF domain-containing protein [Burkholderiales bacterium PBB4]|nr:MAG: GGDEF domain-containing protein [Burkholderiales bacterium PBB4]